MAGNEQLSFDVIELEFERFRTCVGVLVGYSDSDTYNSTFALVDAVLIGPSGLKTESFDLLN